MSFGLLLIKGEVLTFATSITAICCGTCSFVSTTWQHEQTAQNGVQSFSSCEPCSLLELPAAYFTTNVLAAAFPVPEKRKSESMNEASMVVKNFIVFLSTKIPKQQVSYRYKNVK